MLDEPKLLAVVIVAALELRQQIVSHARSQADLLFLAALLEIGLSLLFAFLQLAGKFFARRLYFDQTLFRGREDSIQRVVVRCWNRIELVVVAPRRPRLAPSCCGLRRRCDHQ